MTKIAQMILLLIIAIQVSAQSRKENLNTFFSTLSKNGQFNGNVLIAENGNIIYEKSFGYADLSSKRLNTKQTSFAIASITKTFTSTAILQLKQEGKLKLDDTVSKFLPDFPYKEVTIKHLLSHTAGLPIYDSLFFSYIPNHPDTVFKNKDLIPAFILKKAPLIFKPGEDFSYNNVNYNILALVVEKLSGKSFESYLEEHIFKPSGMTNTSLSRFFRREDKELSKRYNFKFPYSDKPQLVDTVSEFRIMSHFDFQGQGDIISTTHDLLNYSRALESRSLIDEANLKEAFTPVKLRNGKDNAQRYALGWITREDTSLGEIVKHDGGMPGGRTMLLKNLTKHQTIILFDNNGNNVVPIADHALSILNGLAIEKPKKSVSRIYGITMANLGVNAGNKVIERIRKDTVNYYLSEGQINDLGYAFLFNNKEMEAEAAFKKNTQLFPLSWNVYDSYAEVLLRKGNKADAIKMYQKSVELNAANENGKKVLEQLLK